MYLPLLENSISASQIMIYVWLGVFVIMFIAEMVTIDLVSVWFCLGAVAAMVVTFIPGVPFWVGFIVFPLVSVLFLLLLRPLSKRLLHRKILRSNIDELEGIKGKAMKDITEDEPGEVKINGVVWTAVIKEGDKPIKAGTRIRVDAIQGNKLVVSVVRDE